MQQLDPALVKGEFSKQNYEYLRWFSERGGWENYRVMFETLRYHIKEISFKRFLEVGCGPGTWTRLFLQECEDAYFTLVDLSEEMIKQAKRSLGERRNITYVVGDYPKVELDKKFDFFFCSRAIEYVPDKRLFVKKVYENLSKNGRGIIITKNPALLSRKLEALIGRKTPPLHTGKIRHQDLVKLLREGGFKQVKAYPCIINFLPGMKSFKLSRFLWKRLFKNELMSLSNPLSESYIITFTK